MIPEHLYHFTSFESLQKILASGLLKLTNCDDIKNREVETEALGSVIRDILEDSEKKEKLYSKYSAKTDDEVITKLLKIRQNSYISCFTTLEDNENEKNELTKKDLLWKFYADNNQGVVIKFKNYLKGSNLYKNGKRTSKVFIRPVSYEKDILIRTLTTSSSSGDDATSMIAAINDDYIIDSYKPDICQYEKEYRLIYYKPENDKSQPTRYHIHEEKERHGKTNYFYKLGVNLRKYSTLEEAIPYISPFCLFYIENDGHPSKLFHFYQSKVICLDLEIPLGKSHKYEERGFKGNTHYSNRINRIFKNSCHYDCSSQLGIEKVYCLNQNTFNKCKSLFGEKYIEYIGS